MLREWLNSFEIERLQKRVSKMDDKTLKGKIQDVLASLESLNDKIHALEKERKELIKNKEDQYLVKTQRIADLRKDYEHKILELNSRIELLVKQQEELEQSYLKQEESLDQQMEAIKEDGREKLDIIAKDVEDYKHEQELKYEAKKEKDRQEYLVQVERLFQEVKNEADHLSLKVQEINALKTEVYTKHSQEMEEIQKNFTLENEPLQKEYLEQKEEYYEYKVPYSEQEHSLQAQFNRVSFEYAEKINQIKKQFNDSKKEYDAHILENDQNNQAILKDLMLQGQQLSEQLKLHHKRVLKERNQAQSDYDLQVRRFKDEEATLLRAYTDIQNQYTDEMNAYQKNVENFQKMKSDKEKEITQLIESYEQQIQKAGIDSKNKIEAIEQAQEKEYQAFLHDQENMLAKEEKYASEELANLRSDYNQNKEAFEAYNKRLTQEKLDLQNKYFNQINELKNSIIATKNDIFNLHESHNHRMSDLKIQIASLIEEYNHEILMRKDAYEQLEVDYRKQLEKQDKEFKDEQQLNIEQNSKLEAEITTLLKEHQELIEEFKNNHFALEEDHKRIILSTQKNYDFTNASLQEVLDKQKELSQEKENAISQFENETKEMTARFDVRKNTIKEQHFLASKDIENQYLTKKQEIQAAYRLKIDALRNEHLLKMNQLKNVEDPLLETYNNQKIEIENEIKKVTQEMQKALAIEEETKAQLLEEFVRTKEKQKEIEHQLEAEIAKTSYLHSQKLEDFKLKVKDLDTKYTMMIEQNRLENLQILSSLEEKGKSLKDTLKFNQTEFASQEAEFKRNLTKMAMDFKGQENALNHRYAELQKRMQNEEENYKKTLEHFAELRLSKQEELKALALSFEAEIAQINEEHKQQIAQIEEHGKHLHEELNQHNEALLNEEKEQLDHAFKLAQNRYKEVETNLYEYNEHLKEQKIQKQEYYNLLIQRIRDEITSLQNEVFKSQNEHQMRLNELQNEFEEMKRQQLLELQKQEESNQAYEKVLMQKLEVEKQQNAERIQQKEEEINQLQSLIEDEKEKNEASIKQYYAEVEHKEKEYSVVLSELDQRKNELEQSMKQRLFEFEQSREYLNRDLANIEESKKTIAKEHENYTQELSLRFEKRKEEIAINFQKHKEELEEAYLKRLETLRLEQAALMEFTHSKEEAAQIESLNRRQVLEEELATLEKQMQENLQVEKEKRDLLLADLQKEKDQHLFDIENLEAEIKQEQSSHLLALNEMKEEYDRLKEKYDLSSKEALKQYEEDYQKLQEDEARRKEQLNHLRASFNEQERSFKLQFEQKVRAFEERVLSNENELLAKQKANEELKRNLNQQLSNIKNDLDFKRQELENLASHFQKEKEDQDATIDRQINLYIKERQHEYESIAKRQSLQVEELLKKGQNQHHLLLNEYNSKQAKLKELLETLSTKREQRQNAYQDELNNLTAEVNVLKDEYDALVQKHQLEVSRLNEALKNQKEEHYQQLQIQGERFAKDTQKEEELMHERLRFAKAQNEAIKEEIRTLEELLKDEEVAKERFMVELDHEKADLEKRIQRQFIAYQSEMLRLQKEEEALNVTHLDEVAAYEKKIKQLDQKYAEISRLQNQPDTHQFALLNFKIEENKKLFDERLKHLKTAHKNRLEIIYRQQEELQEDFKNRIRHLLTTSANEVKAYEEDLKLQNEQNRQAVITLKQNKAEVEEKIERVKQYTNAQLNKVDVLMRDEDEKHRKLCQELFAFKKNSLIRLSSYENQKKKSIEDELKELELTKKAFEDRFKIKNEEYQTLYKSFEKDLLDLEKIYHQRIDYMLGSLKEEKEKRDQYLSEVKYYS